MKTNLAVTCLVCVFTIIGTQTSVGALTRTESDDLYSEAIYMHRTAPEVPGAFESGARLAPMEEDDLDYYSTATDTLEIKPSELSHHSIPKKSSKN